MDTLERSDAFPIGHNSAAAPLAEILAEETAALKARADALVESAGRATVTDDDTAAKATTLAKMLGDHAKAIDDARTVRKAPFLDGCRTIDNHFQAIGAPLGTARRAVVGMIDEHRRKKQAEADAERRRLEDEARRAREAAERAAAEAAKAGTVDAEIAAQTAAEQADRVAREAATVAPATIDSGYGPKAMGRKVTKHHVVDAKAALKHAMKIDPVRFAATLDEVIKGQIKAKVTVFPGVEFYEETSTVIR